MKYTALIGMLLTTSLLHAQNDLVFEDHVYDPLIHTVQAYPDKGNADDNMLPAIVAFGQTNLLLEFDDLRNNRSNYYAKLIHCNYDWTKSDLMDLDFLHDYNEFTVNDYTFSGNTFQPYIHYRFGIPAVKLAGNYLLIVYRDSPSHLLLSKRIMIYQPAVSILQDKVNNGTAALSFSKQPLNFVIDYSRTEILNPLENLHVVIRQNQRWDNAQVDLKPSFLRDAESLVEFRYPDTEKSFDGGNEFRFVDFRSLNYPGQNTGNLDKSVKPFRLSVALDLPRTAQSYAQYNDDNGGYLIDNKDMGDGKTDANYLPVTFYLKAGTVTTDPVYVMGFFNNWARSDDNRMRYNAGTGLYEATILLKQGIYNYQYVVDSRTLPMNYFEGDHFETENRYEILVYNRTFRPAADQLLGYAVITVNSR